MLLKLNVLKLLLVFITVFIAACSSDAEVTKKIQQDIIEFKESTINITSSDLRFRRFRLMANKGNSEAMVELANSYLYEENVRPFNEKQAIRWLSESAIIGNPHASFELAEIYSEGLSDGEGNIRIKSDVETSLMWSYIAKEQSKNLPGKNLILLNYDSEDKSQAKQTAERAKQRAEQWLTENDT